ncbi:MAG: M48 family metalloprotease [Shimia sp.]|uniref:M48 family metalloprotease n=1 Tax=Shimia sp. TaxID=1954381 RepID=UPI004059B627
MRRDGAGELRQHDNGHATGPTITDPGKNISSVDIAGHLGKTQNNAALGAILIGVAAAAAGAEGSLLDMAVNTGAQVVSRAYSKNFELEADALGTVIAHKSGYNPVRGAEFFARIPDPGDQFLGTHPPNASRMKIVKETAAKL